MIIVIITYANYNVTENNINIMFDAAKRIDNNVLLVEPQDLYKYKKQCEIVISSDLLFALKAKRIGYKTVVSWSQGIVPEESYLRHKSILRYNLLSFLEKKALKKMDYCFFVSKEMKNYYEKKYKMSFTKNSLIFPCFNTDIIPNSFFEKEKYAKNTFVYAGGTAVWQGVENIVSIYSNIENKCLNSKLLLLVKDKDYVLRLVKKYNIKNYEIDYVKKEDLSSVLKKVKFGFILREDNSVNNVSTPTKISTYLSCGVIPIFSSSIKDFKSIAMKMKYAIEYEENTILDRINCLNTINPNEIYNEYNNIFNSYYSAKKYEEDIYKVLCYLKEKIKKE